MKQFTRCTHCQQWYARTYTATVELYQSDSLHCMTIWCLRCIDEAERRSQPPTASDPGPKSDHTEPGLSAATVEQFVQEHLQLMDRALYDDEAILVPIVHDFMERCRRYQTQLEVPEQARRLTGHLQYWETFLKALNA